MQHKAAKKRNWRDVAEQDRSYAMTIEKERGKGPPPLKWQGSEFRPDPPQLPPKMKVKVNVMHAEHERYARRWKGSHKGRADPIIVEAVADTGCQTCTAGRDIVEKLCCPTSYLVPTRHRIVGITDTSLAIAGVLFLRICVDGRQTRQMVYISDNIEGLHLSEEALK